MASFVGKKYNTRSSTRVKKNEVEEEHEKNDNKPCCSHSSDHRIVCTRKNNRLKHLCESDLSWCPECHDRKDVEGVFCTKCEKWFCNLCVLNTDNVSSVYTRFDPPKPCTFCNVSLCGTCLEHDCDFCNARFCDDCRDDLDYGGRLWYTTEDSYTTCDDCAKSYIEDDIERLRDELKTMRLSDIHKQAEEYEKTEWPTDWSEEVYTEYLAEHNGFSNLDSTSCTSCNSSISRDCECHFCEKMFCRDCRLNQCEFCQQLFCDDCRDEFEHRGSLAYTTDDSVPTCDSCVDQYIKDETEELYDNLKTMSLTDIRKQVEEYEMTEWPNVWSEEVYTSYLEERREQTDSESESETDSALIDETDNEGDNEDNGEHGSHHDHHGNHGNHGIHGLFSGLDLANPEGF